MSNSNTLPKATGSQNAETDTQNPIIERMVIAVLKQVQKGGTLDCPLQSKVRKSLTAEMRRLEKRLRKGSETNRLLASACRDRGTTKATEAYAEGSAFAFFQSAQIVAGFTK